MIFKSESSRGDLNGFLDAGSHIHGELRFDDTFRVDGRLDGKITSQGDLVVGERGEIEGEIETGRVFISGTVRGTVRATRRVEVTATGKLYAEIETPTLVIEDGAFFEGRCAMVRGEASARPAPPKAAEPAAPAKRPGGVVTKMPFSRDA